MKPSWKAIIKVRKEEREKKNYFIRILMYLSIEKISTLSYIMVEHLVSLLHVKKIMRFKKSETRDENRDNIFFWSRTSLFRIRYFWRFEFIFSVKTCLLYFNRVSDKFKFIKKYTEFIITECFGQTNDVTFKYLIKIQALRKKTNIERILNKFWSRNDNIEAKWP